MGVISMGMIDRGIKGNSGQISALVVAHQQFNALFCVVDQGKTTASQADTILITLERFFQAEVPALKTVHHVPQRTQDTIETKTIQILRFRGGCVLRGRVVPGFCPLCGGWICHRQMVEASLFNVKNEN